MEKATAFQRVMQLTSPVRRQHHNRSIRGTYGPELWDCDRSFTKQLEQDCLEVIIGAINYQNSLVYGVAFMLGSLFLVTILYTFRNLSGLTIEWVGAGVGFGAGDGVGLGVGAG